MPAQSFWPLAGLMVATGLGIPLLATLNGQFGTRLASPVGASFATFAIGTLICAALLAVGPRVDWSRLPSDRPWLMFGAVFMIFYIVSITYAAPRIGVGNAVFFVLLGQLVAAAAVDHFGVLGAARFAMTGRRALGMVVMAIGVYLAKRGG